MSALFDFQEREVDEDLRAEDRAERRRRARLNHWCSDCHGFTGPNSPCYSGDDEDNEQEDAS